MKSNFYKFAAYQRITLWKLHSEGVSSWKFSQIFQNSFFSEKFWPTFVYASNKIYE